MKAVAAAIIAPTIPVRFLPVLVAFILLILLLYTKTKCSQQVLVILVTIKCIINNMKSEKSITRNSSSGNVMYRLSIGILISAAILIVLGLVSFVQNNTQQMALDEQSKRTSELVGQVKELSEQNKKISQTAVNYTYCNSMILATYTRDQKPISIDDLNKCVISSFPRGEGAPTLSKEYEPTSTDIMVKDSPIYNARASQHNRDNSTASENSQKILGISSASIGINTSCMSIDKILKSCL